MSVLLFFFTDGHSSIEEISKGTYEHRTVLVGGWACLISYMMGDGGDG